MFRRAVFSRCVRMSRSASGTRGIVHSVQQSVSSRTCLSVCLTALSTRRSTLRTVCGFLQIKFSVNNGTLGRCTGPRIVQVLRLHHGMSGRDRRFERFAQFRGLGSDGMCIDRLRPGDSIVVLMNERFTGHVPSRR